MYHAASTFDKQEGTRGISPPAGQDYGSTVNDSNNQYSTPRKQHGQFDQELGLLRPSLSLDNNDNDINNDAASEANSSDIDSAVWDSAAYSNKTIKVGKLIIRLPTLRQLALELSLYFNLFITLAKFITYVRTWSLSVLAALLDSVLDVVSQLVLNYTEKHSGMQQRSSAVYPAGASRLEPIGVLTCAALMGMASFEVLKDSFVELVGHHRVLMEGGSGATNPTLAAFWSMLAIVVCKLALLWLCNYAGYKKNVSNYSISSNSIFAMSNANNSNSNTASTLVPESDADAIPYTTGKAAVQLADPTIEALAQDHWNDALSNSVAAVALLCTLQSPTKLWFLDPVGAVIISIYIIYSWYLTGSEQIEHLTGKAAPEEFLSEIHNIAQNFDDRMQVDSIKAYHFGPKFLVEIEMVMPRNTLLFESHDLGMDLQYEIEALDEVERCFVHNDYQKREYDEHFVSKVPELREKYRPGVRFRSAQSL